VEWVIPGYLKRVRSYGFDPDGACVFVAVVIEEVQYYAEVLRGRVNSES
jgi:hypothetical protein